MALPEKKEELEKLGYVFDNEGNCRLCGEKIEWWITPNNKKMPMRVHEVRDNRQEMSPILYLARRPHFIDCPYADDVHRMKAKKKK